jgi:hypothetical protein
MCFQIVVPPVRIDVMTSIDGVDFSAAWIDRVEAKLGSIKVPVLSRGHLIANKSVVACHEGSRLGRMTDAADRGAWVSLMDPPPLRFKGSSWRTLAEALKEARTGRCATFHSAGSPYQAVVALSIA